MADKLRVPVCQLLQGDVLVPTDRTVQRAPYAGVRTPAGKLMLDLLDKRGHLQTVCYGRSTTVTILRPAAAKTAPPASAGP